MKPGKATVEVETDETPGAGAGAPSPQRPEAGTATPDDAPRVLHVDAPPGSPRWSWWARIPLRSRLVAIVSALLAIGLVVAAISSITLVQRYLVSQVDDELTRNADTVAQMAQSGTQFSSTALPSDYYVEVGRASCRERVYDDV